MRIQQVTLETNHLEEMKRFYMQVLRCTLVEKTDVSVTMQAGETLLTFQQTDEGVPFYHFAFFLRPDLIDEMVADVKANTRLLKDEEGEEEFFASLFWKCRQFYFEDPQRNIVEFLARTDEPVDPQAGPIVRVLEVGMPVPHGQALANELTAISNVIPSESATFRFYGDREGVFVIVKTDRPWFPTDRPATVHPITVAVKGETDRILHPINTPYRVVIQEV